MGTVEVANGVLGRVIGNGKDDNGQCGKDEPKGGDIFVAAIAVLLFVEMLELLLRTLAPHRFW